MIPLFQVEFVSLKINYLPWKRDHVKLWSKWFGLVNQFEGAFNRKKTFFWFIIVLIGFTIKFDSLGVTSLARGAGVLPSYYTSMLHFFNSTAVNLETLQSLWISIIFNHFSLSLIHISEPTRRTPISYAV